MIKISVIIPMYNSFNMLKKNLSILENQKKAKIEVIIIDDCSTDDSFEKAINYSKRSKLEMIVLQNEKNSGPGYSRNSGISYSSGDYITFADSDDYFTDDFVDVLIPILEKNIDCAIFNYLNVDENENCISRGKSIEIPLCEGYIDKKMAIVFTYGTTWGKIYRRKVIVENNVLFGNFFRAEDMPFTKHALMSSNSIYYINAHLYCYVQISTSLMHKTELIDEKNCQQAYSFLLQNVDNNLWKDELFAIELREVLNTTVSIRIQKKDTVKSIKSYINENYSKHHFNNKYFHYRSNWVKTVSYLAYYQQILLLSLMLKLKKLKKQKIRR